MKETRFEKRMDYTTLLPIEILEKICLTLAPARYTKNTLPTPSRSPRTAVLAALPLISSRWHVSGQKALYRDISLETADQYKLFQDSLTLNPQNGMYVRALCIIWGIKDDFGGPDGYSYKVLGWFHEMQIEQVIRLCPLLEFFFPSSFAPVISGEGIAALGTIPTIKFIIWRGVDVQQHMDIILQAHANWKDLFVVELWDIFDFIGAVRRTDEEFPQFLSEVTHLLRRIR